MPDGDIEMWVLWLREAWKSRGLVVALKEMVLDYRPSTPGDTDAEGPGVGVFLFLFVVIRGHPGPLICLLVR